MLTKSILDLLKKESLPFYEIFGSIYFSTPSWDRKHTYIAFRDKIRTILSSLVERNKVLFDPITGLYSVERTNEVLIHEED